VIISRKLVLQIKGRMYNRQGRTWCTKVIITVLAINTIIIVGYATLFTNFNASKSKTLQSLEMEIADIKTNYQKLINSAV
jgi:hypothetical protein